MRIILPRKKSPFWIPLSSLGIPLSRLSACVFTILTPEIKYKHDNFYVGTGYKEEESPAYFRRVCDLFCAKCQHCNQSFSDDSGNMVSC